MVKCLAERDLALPDKTFMRGCKSHPDLKENSILRIFFGFLDFELLATYNMRIPHKRDFLFNVCGASRVIVF